jgi:hypothetical protein
LRTGRVKEEHLTAEIQKIEQMTEAGLVSRSFLSLRDAAT